MGRYASEGSSGNFTPAPAGTHPARCVKIIDIGTHHDSYQGQTKTKNKVIIFWELPNEMTDTEAGKLPAIVTKFYTNSLHEKATLRAELESWRGKQFTEDELKKFDLMKILGAPCLITVIHDTNGRARVNSVVALPKGLVCPEQITPSFAFWLDEWNQGEFDKLTDGIKGLIRDSDEYKQKFGGANGASARQPVAAGAPVAPYGDEEHFKDDDLPF